MGRTGAAMGFAGGGGGTIAAPEVARRVGDMPPSDLSGLWMAGITGDLRAACDDPFSARAVVLAALADPAPAKARIAFDVLDRAFDAGPGHRQLLRELIAVHPHVHQLGPAAPSKTSMQVS